jgi:hypothetical protein
MIFGLGIRLCTVLPTIRSPIQLDSPVRRQMQVLGDCRHRGVQVTVGHPAASFGNHHPSRPAAYLAVVVSVDAVDDLSVLLSGSAISGWRLRRGSEHEVAFRTALRVLGENWHVRVASRGIPPPRSARRTRRLTWSVGSPRSGSNRRPSDYETDARRRSGRLQTDLACSR